MRLSWNDEIKKLAAGMLLFMTAGLLLGNIGMEWCKNQMRREYTLLAGSVLGMVRENYPKVPEEELIRMFPYIDVCASLGRLALPRTDIYQ